MRIESPRVFLPVLLKTRGPALVRYPVMRSPNLVRSKLLVTTSYYRELYCARIVRGPASVRLVSFGATPHHNSESPRRCYCCTGGISQECGSNPWAFSFASMPAESNPLYVYGVCFPLCLCFRWLFCFV